MTTHSLTVPGAILAYDVRESDEPGAPTLLMIGSPMDASGFTTLATHFGDRRVVTYDPRGVTRSERTDGAAVTTTEEHADDLHRLIAEVGGGPVDVFASSGGAVNALVLVATHPDDVRTLVAHEPPAAAALPDSVNALAATDGIRTVYERDGFGPAMVRFLLLTGHKGEIPAGFADRPAPDPAAFGLPAGDDGTRSDPLLGQNLMSCTHHEHDFGALRAAPTRIVVGVGAESEGELANRAGRAVAERLGSEPVVFPSNHGGFLGGEFGMTGDPEGFAVVLRKVLDQ
jgi:pimeloyl-ACP methyl ester carboxylesterase